MIGGGTAGPIEVEGSPGFSLTLGQLPGVELKVIHTLRSGIPEAGTWKGCRVARSVPTLPPTRLTQGINH